MQSIRTFKSIFSATFSLILASGTIYLPSFAQAADSNLRQGLPGRRISGGVREGNCFTDFNQSLVAMIPRNNLGKTISAHPSFWFSIPESSGYREIEFQLFNEFNEIVYRTELETSTSYGLSEFQLPESAPMLTVDTNYRWVLSVGCTEASRFEVQGWIRRVSISTALQTQMATATDEERVTLYEAADLWHEQVTQLVNLRRSNPADIGIQSKWVDLVESAGLMSEIASTIAGPMSAAEPAALNVNKTENSSL